MCAWCVRIVAINFIFVLLDLLYLYDVIVWVFELFCPSLAIV